MILNAESNLELFGKIIEADAIRSEKERGKIRALIESNDVTLKGYFVTHKEEFNRKLKNLKESVLDEKKKNEAQIEILERELQTMIKEGLSTLGEEKLSRDAIAQLLLDMAMKIQGDSPEK